MSSNVSLSRLLRVGESMAHEEYLLSEDKPLGEGIFMPKQGLAHRYFVRGWGTIPTHLLVICETDDGVRYSFSDYEAKRFSSTHKRRDALAFWRDLANAESFWLGPLINLVPYTPHDVPAARTDSAEGGSHD